MWGWGLGDASSFSFELGRGLLLPQTKSFSSSAGLQGLRTKNQRNLLEHKPGLRRPGGVYQPEPDCFLCAESVGCGEPAITRPDAECRGETRLKGAGADGARWYQVPSKACSRLD